MLDAAESDGGERFVFDDDSGIMFDLMHSEIAVSDYQATPTHLIQFAWHISDTHLTHI